MNIILGAGGGGPIVQKHFLTVPISWCHQVNIILGAGAGPIVQGHFLIVPTPAEESLNWAIKIGG